MMAVRYDKPEDGESRNPEHEFWRLTGPLQIALRPPGVVVVDPVPDQRRKGRIEAARLDNWSRIARIVAEQGSPPRGGSVINGALLERVAELLRAISANPALPVAVSRKPVARATVTTTLQQVLAAAGPDHVYVCDLVTGLGGATFLRDLLAYPWIDDGAAATALFAGLVGCSDDEIERAQNKIAQEGDPGSAVRYADKPEGVFYDMNLHGMSTVIARAVAAALDPLDDDQLDQIPVRLAEELARVVLRDRREVDLKLHASLARRGA